MPATKIVRALAYTREDAYETVRRIIWAARDLKLLPKKKLEHLFDKTVDQMNREDFRDLINVAEKLVSILTCEARKKV